MKFFFKMFSIKLDTCKPSKHSVCLLLIIGTIHPFVKCMVNVQKKQKKNTKC